MVRTTREQRVALKRVFDRCWLDQNANRRSDDAQDHALTYGQFRKRVQPTFGCDGCIMIFWCGMWLGIERDGYTHS